MTCPFPSSTGPVLASAHYSLQLYLVRAASCFSGDCHTAMLAIRCGWNSAHTDIIGSEGRVTEEPDRIPSATKKKKKKRRALWSKFKNVLALFILWVTLSLSFFNRLNVKKYAKTQCEMGILAYTQLNISVSKSVELLVYHIRTN